MIHKSEWIGNSLGSVLLFQEMQKIEWRSTHKENGTVRMSFSCFGGVSILRPPYHSSKYRHDNDCIKWSFLLSIWFLCHFSLRILSHILTLAYPLSLYLRTNGLTRASNLSGTLLPSPIFLTI